MEIIFSILQIPSTSIKQELCLCYWCGCYCSVTMLNCYNYGSDLLTSIMLSYAATISGYFTVFTENLSFNFPMSQESNGPQYLTK